MPEQDGKRGVPKVPSSYIIYIKPRALRALISTLNRSRERPKAGRKKGGEPHTANALSQLPRKQAQNKKKVQNSTPH